MPVLPRELQKKVGQVRKVRDEAEVLQRQATMESAEVAADLVERAHLTVRDAGRVLGFPTSVSHNCSRLTPTPRGEAIIGTYVNRAMAKTTATPLNSG